MGWNRYWLFGAGHKNKAYMQKSAAVSVNFATDLFWIIIRNKSVTKSAATGVDFCVQVLRIPTAESLQWI